MTNKSKYKIGYTTGVFDLFHVGHLNILKNAKDMCDFLYVGVTTDNEVMRIKKKKPIIPFEERIEIIKSIRYVDKAVPETNTDKLLVWKKYHFNVIFKGDDWRGTTKWKLYEINFAKLGVDIIYFPYTKGTSSSLLSNTLHEIYKESPSGDN